MTTANQDARWWCYSHEAIVAYVFLFALAWGGMWVVKWPGVHGNLSNLSLSHLKSNLANPILCNYLWSESHWMWSCFRLGTCYALSSMGPQLDAKLRNFLPGEVGATTICSLSDLAVSWQITASWKQSEVFLCHEGARAWNPSETIFFFGSARQFLFIQAPLDSD